MSTHQFDTEIAKGYGIEAAIILQNLSFWIEKNKANNVHFHDGTYWTYNSIKAFNELFPYMSESSIRRTLKGLEEKGIIKTGNYNKVGYDRTTWYAITEKGFCMLNKSILSKYQMEMVKTADGFSQSDEPIPDIKTNKKHDNKNNSAIYSEIESAYLDAPIQENLKDNITSLNNTGNNTIKDKPVKHKHGSFQNVLLTDAEKDRLTKDFHSIADMAIQYLSEYKIEKAYKTNDDNLTIRRWVIDAVRKREGLPAIPKQKPPPEVKARKCPKCGGEMRGGGCTVCFSQFDSEGNEI